MHEEHSSPHIQTRIEGPFQPQKARRNIRTRPPHQRQTIVLQNQTNQPSSQRGRHQSTQIVFQKKATQKRSVRYRGKAFSEFKLSGKIN